MFAQLTVRGKWEGPHVFVVRLRDDQGKTMPGVRILDNGAKVGRPPQTHVPHASCASGMGIAIITGHPSEYLRCRKPADGAVGAARSHVPARGGDWGCKHMHVLQAGLNGVDNGQLWFNHVRVARDALLDRYASVAEDGTYSSPIPSVAQRFGTMVGGLTTGETPLRTPSSGWLPPSTGRVCLPQKGQDQSHVLCCGVAKSWGMVLDDACRQDADRTRSHRRMQDRGQHSAAVRVRAAAVPGEAHHGVPHPPAPPAACSGNHLRHADPVPAPQGALGSFTTCRLPGSSEICQGGGGTVTRYALCAEAH